MKRKKDNQLTIGKIENASNGQINIQSSNINQDNRKINIQEGSYFDGDMSIQGKLVAHDEINNEGINAQEIANLFIQFYEMIDRKSNINRLDKEDLKNDVKDIENEVAKRDQANESFLARRLRNIQRMAPDILDVIVATLSNPSFGFALIVQKVAKKMSAEAK